MNAWGRRVAIYKYDDVTTPLVLGYVAVFATSYDCNLTNTITVASLPAFIAVSSTKTYSGEISLNIACIEQITVL